MLASCGWEATASSRDPWSFTQALIDTLHDLNGTPTTLAQIFESLFRRAQQNQVEACPVHVPSRHRPSVTFARVNDQLSLSPSSRNLPESRVIITARVRDNVPHNPAMWTLWLARNIPPEVIAADITVEAAFQGSCVLLISMPVEIWTMLPRGNPAYGFVAHVNSGLLVPQQHFSPMPIRPTPPPARENSPPRGSRRQYSSLGKRDA